MKVDALLADSGLPRSEALVLLAHASGLTRERLIAASREVVPQATIDAFSSLAARRLQGEPIAYLVGYREFYGRPFTLDARVLIPRPESELLVEHALQWMASRNAVRVLDLGTGSGAIAITLALERPDVEMTASDRDVDALATARANATRLDAHVRFIAGDWFDALKTLDEHDRHFDLLVANPPYIAHDDHHLREGDLRFEPIDALTDGGDGLGAIRRIVTDAPDHLRPAGALMVEHGHDQAAPVRALFVAAGFVSVASAPDLAGIERITSGTRAA
jgi:release factor glutamine methyltransferase